MTPRPTGRNDAMETTYVYGCNGELVWMHGIGCEDCTTPETPSEQAPEGE
jgi:hypothetical protein